MRPMLLLISAMCWPQSTDLGRSRLASGRFRPNVVQVGQRVFGAEVGSTSARIRQHLSNFGCVFPELGQISPRLSCRAKSPYKGSEAPDVRCQRRLVRIPGMGLMHVGEGWKMLAHATGILSWIVCVGNLCISCCSAPGQDEEAFKEKTTETGVVGKESA